MGSQREVARILLANRTRLDELAHWYTQERLGVSVYALMAAVGLQAVWPSAAFRVMEDQYHQQQIRTARLVATLEEIDRAFREEGIKYQVLKGLPLAARFYSGICNRFTWDLDILVRPDSLRKAARVLERLGLSAPMFSKGMLGVAQWVTHALEYQGQGGVSIDLHWAYRRLPGIQFPTEKVFGTGRSIEFAGGSYPVPSDEYLLVQLLLSIAADVDRGRCRWRALWDTWLVLEQTVSNHWDEFLARRKSEGCLGLIVQATAIVVHSMGAQENCRGLLDQFVGHLGERAAMLSEQDAKRLLSRSANDFRNHMEFARWQEVPGWRYWPWWLITLPARAFFARRL